MRRLLCIFIGCFCLAFPLLAQSNKLIKELESKRGALQKQITESETLENYKENRKQPVERTCRFDGADRGTQTLYPYHK